MEGVLAGAQAALGLAVAQYLNACVALHTPLQAASNETNRLYMDAIVESCENFIESVRRNLSDTVIALKKARNRHARIHWIPPELLVRIFQFDLDKHKCPIESLPFTPSLVPRTVSLSTVCSHWRELIVETSSFWSHIPIHRSENLVVTCIQRALDRPLDVVAIEPRTKSVYRLYRYHKPWEGERVLKEYANNIRSLNVDAYTEERIRWVIDWISQLKTPCRLKELSVMFTGESWPSRYSSGSAIKLDSLAKQLHTLCLKQIHADWTGCTFDRLCVLKLSDIRCIGADEFERIITTSPMLRILELRRVSILSRKSDSKPVVSQNLEILRLSYLDSLTLRDVFNILAPATYDIELDVDADCLRGSNPRRAKITDEISMLKYRINKYKTHTIRGLGITRAPALLKPLLSSLVSFLPDLTTLRIEGMVLSRDLLLVVESTLQSCPQIKTLQMRRIQTDVETFKNVIENSFVDRIELADCWSTWNDTKSRITPGTPSFEWGLKSAPKVLFLKE